MTAYDFEQLAAALEWTPRRLRQAVALGVIPEPQVRRPAALGPRWAPAVVRDLRRRRAELGSDINLGQVTAYGMADILSIHTGLRVTAPVVFELEKYGRMPSSGTDRGRTLYAAWRGVRFNDLPALQQAIVSGRVHTADTVAGILQVRRTDVDQLIRDGWLSSVCDVRNQHGSTVPLYRFGDVVAISAHPDIDWVEVRSARPGQRSAFRRLGPITPAGRIEIDDLARGALYHRLGHRYWAANNPAAALASWEAAGPHGPAGQHLAAVRAYRPEPVDRCAVWIALLSPEQNDLTP